MRKVDIIVHLDPVYLQNVLNQIIVKITIS